MGNVAKSGPAQGGGERCRCSKEAALPMHGETFFPLHQQEQERKKDDRMTLRSARTVPVEVKDIADWGRE
jgi:hypothetical protein